jgi:hypothetical protein
MRVPRVPRYTLEYYVVHTRLASSTSRYLGTCHVVGTVVGIPSRNIPREVRLGLDASRLAWHLA